MTLVLSQSQRSTVHVLPAYQEDRLFDAVDYSDDDLDAVHVSLVGSPQPGSTTVGILDPQWIQSSLMLQSRERFRVTDLLPM